jgi:hypothetical protein
LLSLLLDLLLLDLLSLLLDLLLLDLLSLLLSLLLDLLELDLLELDLLLDILDEDGSGGRGALLAVTLGMLGLLLLLLDSLLLDLLELDLLSLLLDLLSLLILSQHGTSRQYCAQCRPTPGSLCVAAAKSPKA